MPTILEIPPYRFFFFSNESFKSLGVSICRENVSARFFLETVRLDENFGFGPEELENLEAIIREYQPFLLEKWEYLFG